MKRARLIGAFAAAAAISATCAACAPSPSSSPDLRVAPVVLTGRETSMLRVYGTSDTAFGLGVLGAVCKNGEAKGNVAISPVSIASSLGLAMLGARGGTARSMAKVLHLPATSSSKLAAGLRTREQLLSSLDGPGVTFKQSNHIWADTSLPTKRAYLRELRTAYQAKLTRLPLTSDPGQAAGTINASVSADTDGHIPNLVSPDSLGGRTGWVLTNALYLDAAWKHPFSPQETKPGQFSAGTGQVTASYLNGGGFRTVTDAGFTAVSLPYKGGRLSMLALLPKDASPADGGGCVLPAPGQLSTVESKLATTHQRASIALPKVKLSWSGSLNQPLTSLGMGVAFSQRADFSGISDQACCIGFVQHAATLQVAEKGTIASAATATGVSATALIATQVHFDRPYLLVLEDTLTGEPLMLAWVANPASS